MKHYICIEERLYILTKAKYNKWIKLFPDVDCEDENYTDALDWIEKNGKFVDSCTTYNY